MKRIVLFSVLTPGNEEAILDRILPKAMQGKTLAYMPSEGIEGAQEYIKQWEGIAHKYDVSFSLINNQSQAIEEKDKLHAADVLVISGGNTFKLLRNLRESGLDKSIESFVSKPDFVLAGFSAGAIVLTPSIEICNLPGFDENMTGLKRLNSLNIVDFEILPHYKKELHEKILEDYRNTTKNDVREITDEDYIIIDL